MKYALYIKYDPVTCYGSFFKAGCIKFPCITAMCHAFYDVHSLYIHIPASFESLSQAGQFSPSSGCVHSATQHLC